MSRPNSFARVAAGLLPLVIAGCSAAPREATVSRMVPPEEPPAISAARNLASEQFYQGKSLALAGESDCAREAFHEALETFRRGARGNPSDLAFASELCDSSPSTVRLRGRARAAEAERPPAEDPRDSLVATAPSRLRTRSRRRKRRSARRLREPASTFRSS